MLNLNKKSKKEIEVINLGSGGGADTQSRDQVEQNKTHIIFHILRVMHIHSDVTRILAVERERY